MAIFKKVPKSFCTSVYTHMYVYYIVYTFIFHWVPMYWCAIWLQPIRDGVTFNYTLSISQPCTLYIIYTIHSCKYSLLLMYRRNNTCHFCSLFVDSRLVLFLVIYVAVCFKMGSEKELSSKMWLMNKWHTHSPCIVKCIYHFR